MTRILLYVAAVIGALATVALFLVSGGRGRLPDLKRAFRRIDAEAEAKRALNDMGHERAVQKIKNDHQEELDALDERQKEEAERLGNDPVALSRFLADLARR